MNFWIVAVVLGLSASGLMSWLNGRLALQNRRLRSLLDSARAERAILREYTGMGAMPRAGTRAEIERTVRDCLRLTLPAHVMLQDVRVWTVRSGELAVDALLAPPRPWWKFWGRK